MVVLRRKFVFLLLFVNFLDRYYLNNISDHYNISHKTILKPFIVNVTQHELKNIVFCDGSWCYLRNISAKIVYLMFDLSMVDHKINSVLVASKVSCRSDLNISSSLGDIFYLKVSVGYI